MDSPLSTLLQLIEKKCCNIIDSGVSKTKLSPSTGRYKYTDLPACPHLIKLGRLSFRSGTDSIFESSNLIG